MAEENVKVAVRVRPFNQREKDSNSKLVVQMQGNQTLITNPKTNEEKKFAFDYSYWSHDGYRREPTGYYSPESSKYADQKKVYSDLGAGVLKNAWEGFNASLFAYGQTGSGKSYSVVGYPENKGIVPMVCEDIFKTKATKTGMQVEVTFSMLEIYSEIVRDLLNSKGDKKSGLQVREDPKNGFYPVGLTKSLVDSYEDINKLMDVGTANRTIAATNMNATSSRAHTIVTINLVQKYKNEVGKEMAKSSLINLVDLAGSERADQTGATGDRLKEGAAINLSLTSLGNVISALADNSSGKNARVPYRDSQLTKLLSNALGGNSKTIMIAAISPADINFDESLSTLRYADRAKQIKCKAMVNEDPTEKLIADLKAENERLKNMIKSGKIDPSVLNSTGGAGGAVADDAMKKTLEENEKAMKAMQQSYEEKLAAAKAQTGNMEISKALEKAKTTPHLSNVNMDPTLTGTIKLILEGEGQKTLAPPGKGDIPLNGLGINAPHATITIKGGKYTLASSGNSKVLRNGAQITGPVELVHRDRLLFGASQYYVFVEPSKAKSTDPFISFESMQDEIAQASGLTSKEARKNMTPEELACQAELIDLLPLIDEANEISIAMDKKIKYSVLAVSAEARGEYEGKLKPYVSVKNFETGLEWIWTKQKFMDRKHDFTEYFNDFKDDGVINTQKFKNYDPFFESPDTPTQIGTVLVIAKSLAYMVPVKGDFDILNFRSKNAGALGVEITPCNAQGKPYTEKDNVVVKNPNDLLNKPMSFLISLNQAKNISSVYEDMYCQFQMINDKTVYKSEVIKGTNSPNFKYTKQFNLTVTPQLLDILLNKYIMIQVWGEQKHPQPNPNNKKLSTKEYFEKDKQNEQERFKNLMAGRQQGPASNNAGGNANNADVARLREELEANKAKVARYEAIMMNLQQLANSSGANGVHPEAIKSALNGQQYRGPPPPAYNNNPGNQNQNNASMNNNNKSGFTEKNDRYDDKNKNGQRQRRDSSGSRDGRKHNDGKKNDNHSSTNTKEKSSVCTVL